MRGGRNQKITLEIPPVSALFSEHGFELASEVVQKTEQQKTSSLDETSSPRLSLSPSSPSSLSVPVVHKSQGGPSHHHHRTQMYPSSQDHYSILSLHERTSLTWTHNTVCFNTSDIEYVVSWVDLASGGGLHGILWRGTSL